MITNSSKHRALKIINTTKQHTHTGLLHTPSWMQWCLCASIGLICLILAGLGESGRLLFRYQMDIPQSAQFWRLLTAHFVHLGWSHFLLNAIGLILVWFIYGGVFKVSQWLLVIVVSSLGISIGLLWFDPAVVWYVGLSGVLHALLSAGLIYVLMNALFNKRDIFHLEDAVLLIGLILKLGYEQRYGAIPFTESGSGGPVIVNAHFYGAIMGCFCAVFLFQFTNLTSD